MYKIVLFLFLINCWALAEEWQVDKEGNNNVTFYSSTTLLDFTGTTGNIDGYMYWEGDSILSGHNEVYFEVLPATFETGIGKRDSDMRNDVLETSKYPVASFSGQVVQRSQAGNKITVKVNGKLTLHGVLKPLTIEASILLGEDTMTVTSSFNILLKDYNIDAPTLMAFVKVAQQIKIEVTLNLHKTNT